MSDQDNKHWYVLRAVFHGEEAVRDMLRREGFQCYVPMTYRVLLVHQRMVRRLVPAISELVFVYGSQSDISDFKRHCKKTVYWLSRPTASGPEYIIISDKDMDNFIRITHQHESEVTYFRPEELRLGKGDRIRILGGPLNGVEGVLLKIKGKREKQFVVSIPGIAAATISVRPELVELKSKKVSRSNNLSGDTRELIRLSAQMLLSPPDKYTQSAECDMLCFEIRRLYESLISLRGFLPAQEGELSLSLLMAEHALSEIRQEMIQRFRKALSALGNRTLLSTRMHLIGGALLQDKALFITAQNTLASWQSAGLTSRQQSLIIDLMPWINFQMK